MRLSSNLTVVVMLYGIGSMALIDVGYWAKELTIEVEKIMEGLSAFLYYLHLASRDRNVLP